MKLILTADVTGLGAPGDIVEVKDGYGRNYLLPRGLAIVATKGAEKQIQVIRRAQDTRRVRDLDHAKEIKASLEGLGSVTLKAKAAAGSKKLFGSVTSSDVVSAVLRRRSRAGQAGHRAPGSHQDPRQALGHRPAAPGGHRVAVRRGHASSVG